MMWTAEPTMLSADVYPASERGYRGGTEPSATAARRSGTDRPGGPAGVLRSGSHAAHPAQGWEPRSAGHLHPGTAHLNGAVADPVRGVYRLDAGASLSPRTWPV